MNRLCRQRFTEWAFSNGPSHRRSHSSAPERPSETGRLGLAILIVGVLALFPFSARPIVKADAIKILGLVGDPKSEPGTNLLRLSVALSNASGKTIQVAFRTLQTGRDGSWTNTAEALDPGENLASDIGPHGCVTQALVYNTSPPQGDWRLQFFVAEKVTGVKRFMERRRAKLSLYESLNPEPMTWGPFREVVSPVFGTNSFAREEGPR
jgi:hypothetical protein